MYDILKKLPFIFKKIMAFINKNHPTNFFFFFLTDVYKNRFQCKIRRKKIKKIAIEKL